MKFAIILLIAGTVMGFASADEISAAREGAPPHISENASIMIWENGKYIQKVQGTNQFMCLVWADEQGTFEPSCFNQAAVESVFPVYEFQRSMLEKGEDIKAIVSQITVKANSGEFPTPNPGALVYMMSERNKYFDHYEKKLYDVGPHLMLYYPKLNPDSLGFGVEGLPDVYDDYPHLSVIHVHAGGSGH